MLTWCWTRTSAQLPRDCWADAVLEGLTSLPRACLQLLDERAEHLGSSAFSRSGDGAWLEAEPPAVRRTLPHLEMPWLAHPFAILATFGGQVGTLLVLIRPFPGSPHSNRSSDVTYTK